MRKLLWLILLVPLIASAAFVGNRDIMFPSGSFAPDDISGLQLWLDSEDTTTLHTNTGCTTDVTTSGDAVQCWEDKSANGWDFTEGTSYPDWTDSGVEFDRSNTEYLSAASLTVSLSDIHVFIVLESDHVGGGNQNYFAAEDSAHFHADWQDVNGIIFYADADNDNIAMYHDGGATSRFMDIHGSSTFSADTVVLAEMYVDFIDEDSELWLDGTSQGTDSDTGTSSNWAPDIFRISSSAHTTGEANYDGTIYEILIYDSQITGSDLTDVHTYLDDKYTIPGL